MFYPMFEAIQVAQHLHAIQYAILFVGIIIQKTHQLPGRILCQVLRQTHRRIARTQHQHRLGGKFQVCTPTGLFPHAVEQTAAAHQQDQQHRVQDQHGTRHNQMGAQHPQHEGNDRGGKQHRQDDAPQIGQAGVTPDPAIQTEPPEHGELQGDHPQHRVLQFGQKMRRQLEVKTQ